LPIQHGFTNSVFSRNFKLLVGLSKVAGLKFIGQEPPCKAESVGMGIGVHPLKFFILMVQKLSTKVLF
jgi:hypothetical protein